MKRLLLLLVAPFALQACTSSEQYSLDKAIPRLQTPADQIASLRTKWRDGDHMETVFYDHQNRILERFSFGRSSSKELHFYVGNLQKKTIYYSHGDSSAPGVVSIDTVTRHFDANGRLMMEYHAPATWYEAKVISDQTSYKKHFTYTSAGDTLERLVDKSGDVYTPLADINRWNRDAKNRAMRRYRLYVLGPPADTVEHYSQRFACDQHGRLKLAWFDSMYLGQFYLVPGPDSIWYHYNAKNQLSEERHLYSTDMRNKQEIDTTKLTKQDRESVNFHRNYFLTNKYGNGNRKYVIRYKYEKFDPAKHEKLIIP